MKCVDPHKVFQTMPGMWQMANKCHLVILVEVVMEVLEEISQISEE